MPSFLVEAYTPALKEHALTELVARALATADEMSRQGTEVRFVQTIFVPEDETCLHLFDAPSPAAAREAAERAALLDDDPAASVKASLDLRQEAAPK